MNKPDLNTKAQELRETLGEDTNSMERVTLRRKVSRTSALRDCVEGFWQAH